MHRAESSHAGYRPSEELASSVIHGIGIVLSIAGLAVLAAHAAPVGDARHIASVGVYGTTLILLYTASTLYHGVPIERAKPLLRQLDHAAIFLLIAGQQPGQAGAGRREGRYAVASCSTRRSATSSSTRTWRCRTSSSPSSWNFEKARLTVSSFRPR